MKVEDLIKELEQYDSTMDVYINRGGNFLKMRGIKEREGERAFPPRDRDIIVVR